MEKDEGYSYFVESSVAYGLNFNEFIDLPDDKKHKLIILISRISEKSFRRGFQHGCYQTENKLVRVDSGDLRFNISLDRSPDSIDGLDSGCSAVERLYVEEQVLNSIGLGCLDNDAAPCVRIEPKDGDCQD